MMAAPDPIADAFEATEKRLSQWGIVCRRASDALGLPRQSTMESMLNHVRAEERRRRGVRRRAITAAGKQPRTFRVPTDMLDSEVLRTDKAIAGLPGWAKKVVLRTFLYGQPDRIASREMHMRQGEYAQRRRAAVEMVAMRLSDRYILSLPTRPAAP